MSTYYCSYCGGEVEIISPHMISRIYVNGMMRKPIKKEKWSLQLAKWHSYKGSAILCPGSECSVLEHPPKSIGRCSGKNK